MYLLVMKEMNICFANQPGFFTAPPGTLIKMYNKCEAKVGDGGAFWDKIIDHIMFEIFPTHLIEDPYYRPLYHGSVIVNDLYYFFTRVQVIDDLKEFQDFRSYELAQSFDLY